MTNCNQIKKLTVVFKLYIFWYTQAYEWCKQLDWFRGKPGFKDNVVTPYIHIMEAHVTTIMIDHGNLKMFTGQGMLCLDIVFRILCYASIKWM